MWWWSVPGTRGPKRRWPLRGWGPRSALLTTNLDTVAQMSCNPAIGGVAKGQIVREIDALGGAMGRAIDATGIQFRLLNRRKGPAMHSPRAQADKRAYQQEIKRLVELQPNLGLAAGDGRRSCSIRASRRRQTSRSRAGRARARRRGLSCAGRDPDHRHLPAGPDAHRRSQDGRAVGPARGPRRDQRGAAAAGIRRSSDSRPARRRDSMAAPSTIAQTEEQPGDEAAAAVLVPDRSARRRAAALLDHAHQSRPSTN